jgi:hypothetical protein
MKGLERKKEIILQHELIFADAIGSTVFEKPKVSFWMILIPILFLYFIYRIQRFKTGRLRFNEEFMVTRRRAMELALDAAGSGLKPDFNQIARQTGLVDALEKPYASWLRVLVAHYADLLAADGENFETLVRSAYRNRTNYLLTLNRLNAVEKEFYAALKPQMAATDGAPAIIGIIEEKAQSLRRASAESIFA